MCKNTWFRTEKLLGPEVMELLRKSHVLVAGVGGVGSHASEALCRLGVGTLTLVDPAEVTPSNCNRQIQATTETVGRKKVEVLAARFRTIQPAGRFNALAEEVGKDNVADVIPGDVDCVLDAVDGLASKVAILTHCVNQKIPVLTCLGAAGRYDPSKVRIAPLVKTRNCRLGRFLRKRLRRRAPWVINKVTAVYSEEQPGVSDVPVAQEKPLGSLPFVPAAVGISAAYAVYRRLVDGA